MQRKYRNLLILFVQLLFAGLLTFYFWYELRLTFTLPKVVGYTEILILVLVGYSLTSVLRHAQIALTGKNYYKIQERLTQIKSGKTTILYDYLDSAVRGALIEEAVFRIIPYGFIFILGLLINEPLHTTSSQVIAMGTTSLWVALHDDRIVQMVPLGIVFYLLLVNGLVIESIVIHVAINTLSFGRILFTSNLENE